MASDKFNNSYSLVSTSPKLTGNVKITIDSAGEISLNTISATPALSDRRFKKRMVGRNKKLGYDIADLFGRGTIKQNLIFESQRLRSDFTFVNSYERQTESQYHSGITYLNTKLYDEEFAAFAPINFKRDIPEFFVIFRIEDAADYKAEPVDVIRANVRYLVVGDGSINYDGGSIASGQSFFGVPNQSNYSRTGSAFVVLYDGTVGLETPTTSQAFRDKLFKSEIVKSFDLREGTNIGDYLRGHFEDELYTGKSIEVEFDSKTAFYHGIDLRSGEMTTKPLRLNEFLEKDIPFTDFDRYITNGFQSLNMVSTNIFNLEFLFNDEGAEDYKFYRYWGMYCDTLDLGTFKLDYQSMFSKSGLYPSNVNPDLIRNRNFDVAKDENGVQIIADPTTVRGTLIRAEQIKDFDSVFVIEDVFGNPYKLNNAEQTRDFWFRISNKEIRVSDLVNVVDLNEYPTLDLEEDSGTAATYFEVESEEFLADEYLRIRQGDRVLGEVYADELPNFQDEPYSPYDSEPFQPGKNLGYFFYPRGTKEEVAEAIKRAIDFIISDTDVALRTLRVGNRVYVISLIGGEYGNDFSLEFVSIDQSKINFYNRSLVGGTLELLTRARVTSDLNIDENTRLKVRRGYAKIRHVALYLEEPVFIDGKLVDFNGIDEYRVLTLADETQTVSINDNDNAFVGRIGDVKFSLLSFYNVKVLDTDFFESSYSYVPREEYKRYYGVEQLQVGNVYTVFRRPRTEEEATVIHDGVEYFEGDTFTANNDEFEVITGQAVIIDNRFINDQEVKNFTGLSTLPVPARLQPDLAGIDAFSIENKLEILNSGISTEYQFLAEDIDPNFALTSRFVSDVLKWTRTDSKDIRDNPYRLNANSGFRVTGFSPSFQSFTQRANQFSHEWPYIGAQPENISLRDLVNSRFYFPIKFDLSEYRRQDINYFSRYFTLDFQILEKDGRFQTIPVNRQNRFSTFTEGRRGGFNTFFRGVDMGVVPKLVGTDLSRFRDYRFSCVMNIERTEIGTVKDIFKIQLVENKDSMTMTCVITAVIDDYKVLPSTEQFTSQFMDYSYMYMMRSLKRIKDVNNSSYELGLEIPLIQLPAANFFNQSASGLEGPVESFRGVQLPVKANYQQYTGPSDVLRFDNKFRISEYIIPLLELTGQQLLSNTGVFGKIISQSLNPDTGFLEFSAFTSPNPQISPSEIILNVPSTIERTILDTDILLENSGMAVLFLQSLTSSIIADPADVNNLFYQLNRPVFYYEGGGGEFYNELARLTSFANIREEMEENGKHFEFLLIQNGEYIEGAEPDFDIKFNKPKELKREVGVVTEVGSARLGDLPGTIVQTVSRSEVDAESTLQRYNGDYEPKANDVIRFKDEPINLTWGLANFPWSQANYSWQNPTLESVKVTWASLNEEWTSYDQSWRSLRVEKERINEGTLPFSDVLLGKNTGFDIEAPGFGLLNNLYLHRSNGGESAIIESSNPFYPSVGEYAILRRPKNIFASQWEFGESVYSGTKLENDPRFGTYDLKLRKNFMSNIIFQAPEDLRIDDYAFVEADVDEIGGNERVVVEVDGQRFRAYIDLNNVLIDHFRNKSGAEFETYLKDFNTAGQDQEEAIVSFIEQNLIPIYEIARIDFYVLNYSDPSRSLPLLVGEYEVIDLLRQQYKRTNNIDLNSLTNNRYRITYAIPQQDRVSVGFSINLRRV